MKVLHVYIARNPEGFDLLERIIRPLAASLGLALEVPNLERATTRREMLTSHVRAQLILFDGTLSEGHAYGSLTELPKLDRFRRKYLLVSRTHLPTNVAFSLMCAPIHAHHLRNEEIGRWLEKLLPALVHEEPLPDPLRDGRRHLPAWITRRPGDTFISFRSTQEGGARELARHLEAGGRRVRLVPVGEYAYPTECFTMHQLWEGVARLGREMNRCPTVIIYDSEDYFDSFWTASELLYLLRYRLRKNGELQHVFISRNGKLHPAALGPDGLDVRPLRSDERRLLKFNFNNSDPLTVGPEMRVPPRGPARLMAAILRRTTGHYRPEYAGPEWWDDLRAPCPHCRPRQRRSAMVDWSQHLTNHRTPVGQVDYFGYFIANPQELEGGCVSCPQCGSRLTLVNQRPSRYLWAPVQTTEADQSRSPIVEKMVWEVK